MGLDLYLLRVDREGPHASWSYGGFNQFRRRLAAEVGIDLSAMSGFGGITPWPLPGNEPLVYLFDHSDCDGELDYWACKGCEPRLREIVEAWPDDPLDYDRDRALALCDMMREVVAGDAESVSFR